MMKHQKDQEQNISEIRPITEDESKMISKSFAHFASGMQIFLNSLQRHVSTTLGAIILNDHKGVEVNSKNLLSGFSSRLAYSSISTYPCLQVRQIMRDNESPQYLINLSTALVDSCLGVPLEVNSLRKTMELLGVKISAKDVLSSSAKSFAPFFIRNSLSWCAINNNSTDDLQGNVLRGVAAGVVSTFFHNVGMTAIKNSPNKTWQETWSEVIKDVSRNPNIFKGANVRAFSIASSAFLLSPQATDFLTQKFEEIFDPKTPSQSPKNSSAQSVSGAKEATKIK